MNCFNLIVFVLALVYFCPSEKCCYANQIIPWEESWKTNLAPWEINTRIPMTEGIEERGKHNKFKIKKKFKRFLLPLLLAYKLKFFTLIPVLIGGLVLLTGATGLAGFFFALFAAVMGLKGSHH